MAKNNAIAFVMTVENHICKDTLSRHLCFSYYNYLVFQHHNHLDYPPLWRLMEYRIVRSKTLEGLEEDVNAAMAEGWIATGGAMNQPFGFAGYFQAMVRD